jgi:type II secretory pathway component PulJ
MKRRAFTLVEMVAVIAVSSAITGVGIVMLVALLKSEGSSRRHLEMSKSLTRLEEQFRADAHAAASAKLGEQGDSLELTLPAPSDVVIRYRCQPNEIAREEIAADKTVRRESYALPDQVNSSLDQTVEGPITTLIVQVEPKPVEGSKIRYPSARIEAVLAKDHRFQQPENPK